jgi:hypothetical protein
MKTLCNRLVSHSVVLALAIGTAYPALAQSPPVPSVRVAPASPEPAWGISAETSYYVGSPAFHNAVPDVSVVSDGLGSAYFTGTGTSYAWAPVNLPQGAAITGFDFYYYDANALNISAGIYEVNATGSMPTQIGTNLVSSGSSGFGSVSLNLLSPWTVNNDANSYWAMVGTGATPATDLKWRGVRVRYKLQVSPAPGVATFSDVPTSYWAFQYIEALAASGITVGVTPTTFEPESPVTRAQMAVFLAKALGLNW